MLCRGCLGRLGLSYKATSCINSVTSSKYAPVISLFSGMSIEVMHIDIIGTVFSHYHVKRAV